MPTRPLERSRVCPSSAAMFDALSCGRVLDAETVLAAGIHACLTMEGDDALKNGKRVRKVALSKGANIPEDAIRKSGARDLCQNRLMIAVRSGRLVRDGKTYRMTAGACAQWLDSGAATTPSRPAPNRQPDRIFAGITETNGFAAAPLVAFRRVHFETDKPIPVETMMAGMPAGTSVTCEYGRGLYRVDHRGTATTKPLSADALATLVKEWCARHGIATHGLRAEPRLMRRRTLDLLNPAFLDAACRYYLPLAMKRVRRNQSTLNIHFGHDEDELQQQVSEWLITALTMFDHTKNVPFGAFLTQKLGRWVYDLPRDRFGRQITDHEKFSKMVVAQFQQEHHRRPTDRERAELLGQPVDRLRKNDADVKQMNDLRHIQSTNRPADLPDLPITTGEAVEDDLLGNEEKTLVSAALTKACEPRWDAEENEFVGPNLIGFMTLYSSTWGEKTRTEIAQQLGTSTRTVGGHAGTAGEQMRHILDRLGDAALTGS